MTQANVATGLGWPSASPARVGTERPNQDRGTSLGWPQRIPAAPADLAPVVAWTEAPDGLVPQVAADPSASPSLSAAVAAPVESARDLSAGSTPTTVPTPGSMPEITPPPPATAEAERSTVRPAATLPTDATSPDPGQAGPLAAARSEPVAGLGQSREAHQSPPATPADGPPARPLQARESLVRDALAQLANDVSRETPTAAGSAEQVSRETSHPDVSRETVPAPEELTDTPIAAAAATAMRVRDTSDVFPRPPQTRIVTIANQKGGVGKTTTTVNLATALALHGSRVLCIDLDPQGNASTGLGIDHQSGTPSIYEVLINDRPMREVVQEAAVPGLFCAPATIDLAGAEIELVSVVARETRLRRAIAAYEQPLDYVLIDCPPSLGLLTVNALVAAQEMLIPIQCEYYALEGLGQLLRNVDLIRSHLNQDLAVSTILLTMYDGRTRLAEQVADEVRSHFGELVLTTAIPRSVRISEAPGYGQSVLTYDPASRGAVAYLAAAREFAERGARPATEESR